MEQVNNNNQISCNIMKIELFQ